MLSFDRRLGLLVLPWWPVPGHHFTGLLQDVHGGELLPHWSFGYHNVHRGALLGSGRQRLHVVLDRQVPELKHCDFVRDLPCRILLRVHRHELLRGIVVRGRQVHVRDGAGVVRVVRHRAVLSGGCDVVLDVRGWDVQERDGLECVRLVSFRDVLRHDRSDGSVGVLRGWKVLFGGRHGLHVMCSRQDRQLGGRVGVRCVPRRDLLKCRSVGVQCVCQGHLRVIAGVERVRSVLAWPVWRVGKTHGVLRLSGGNVRGVVWVDRVRRLHGGVVLQG